MMEDKYPTPIFPNDQKEPGEREVKQGSFSTYFEKVEVLQIISPSEVPIESSDVYFINNKCIQRYTVSVDDTAIELFFRVSSDIEIILKAVCSQTTVLDDYLIDMSIDIIEQNSPIVFLLGDGGIGKSTLLVQLAVKYGVSDSFNSFLLQIKRNQKSEKITKTINYINSIIKESNKQAIIFIDNPFENPEIMRLLLEETRNNGKIKLVIAERLNRMSIIHEEVITDYISGYAKGILICSSKNNNHGISWLDKRNLWIYVVDKNWKKAVLSRIFKTLVNSGEVDSKTINHILDKLNWEYSLHELYNRTRIKYNKLVESDKKIDLRFKIKFDWDEWESTFADIEKSQVGEKIIPLKNVFPFIASLDLFNIKTGINLIAKLTQIDFISLNYLFSSRLQGNAGEPALYNSDDERCDISLRHDIVSDDYFSSTNNNPQFYLTYIIDYLDADTVVQFEKAIFKRKYIQGDKEVPRNVNLPSLLRKFESHNEYLEILDAKDRLYSFDLAKVWEMSQRNRPAEKAAITDEWAKLLKKYPSSSKTGEKIWQSCIDDCARYERDLPAEIAGNNFSLISYSLKKASRDKVEITNLWSRVLQENIPKNNYYDLMIWKRCFLDCLKYDLDTPAELMTVIQSVSYQRLSDVLSQIEEFVLWNGFDKEKYFKIAIEIYEKIKNDHPHDIQSRMQVAKIKEDRGDFYGAEEEYTYIIDNINSNNYQTLNALGELYSKWWKNDWKKNNNKHLKDIAIKAESYLQRAIEVSSDNRAISVCSLAKFYYNILRNFKKAEESYKTAVLIGTNNFSAYNGLGMLYANPVKYNMLFNPINADECFRSALEYGNGRQLVSALIPYGNFLYAIGDLEQSEQKFNQALKIKTTEKNAKKMIQNITNERNFFNDLRMHKPIRIDDLDAACRVSAWPESFDDETIRLDIFLVLLRLIEEENSEFLVKKALEIKKNMRNCSGSWRQSILTIRLEQHVEMLCYKQNISKEYAWQNFKTTCYHIHKLVKASDVDEL